MESSRPAPARITPGIALLAAAALIAAALLALALVPASAQADPRQDEDERCTAVLTGTAGENQAELDLQCDFSVTDVLIEGNKDFLVTPLAPGEEEGGFLCTPAGTDEWNCQGPGTEAATFTILSEDPCGEEGDRLVLDLTLAGEESAEEPQAQQEPELVREIRIRNLQAQCEEPPDNGGGNGDRDDREDGGDGDVKPRGGVETGGGGTAFLPKG